MFDWEDLRHFAALAQNGSLSAAARSLQVEHATVSRRVASLEKSLDIKLVDRRPRSYVLTATGEQIAALASQMQEQAFSVDRAAHAVQHAVASEVTIRSPPSMARGLIAPRLWILRTKHPNIYIRLIGDNRGISLSRREADIAVGLCRPSEKRIVARKVGQLRFDFYATPNYVARHVPDRFCFIAYDESAKGLPQQDWLKSIAGSRPIVVQTTELEAQWAAARTGVGIAALPHFLGEPDTQLVRVELAARQMTRDVWLSVHQDLRRVAAIRVVLQFLASCF